MKISREDVLHVAELAHLELTEAEVEIYRQQLDAILSYMDKLNQLDTTNVEPMAQSPTGTPGGEPAVLRDDTPAACDLRDPSLSQAPDPSKPYFRVPKVIER
jgi:aspartyl-tRNA(Asn)/glutamyl-tRNA(Gln) amidotransferase subunit C